MSCPHCYLNKEETLEELTLVEIVSLLNELADLGVLALSITGGEPGLRRDLPDVIKEAADRHFLVSLKTSAYPFTLSDIDLLWDRGLYRLYVSLYHTDGDEHDRFVGRAGAWKRTVEALERFSQRGGNCFVSCPIMQWNASAISDVLDFCDSRGWRAVVDPKITRRDDGSCAPCSFIISERNLLSVLKDNRITSLPAYKHDLSKPPCKAGASTAYVTPNGSIKACPSIPWVFGNVRERSFSEIWTNASVRKRLLSLRWDESHACRQCSYESYCNRCPGESILEHGDPSRPATIDCFLARARRRHAEEGVDSDSNAQNVDRTTRKRGV